MPEYCIWIVSHPVYVHTRCFEEIGQSLSSSIHELGHDCPIVKEYQPDRKNIVLGAHILGDIPKGCVVYNLEQGKEWLSPQYLNILQKSEVWDFSRNNIEYLKWLGVKAQLCEIGYSPVLTRIQPEEETIDVLFYGSINERRQLVLQEIMDSGLKVQCLFGIYGNERDEYIAKAKIVLNLHFYESKLFEMVRCSYLMANKKCVVSEIGEDSKLEDPYREGIFFANYADLAAICGGLCDNNLLRKNIAEKGFKIFSEKSQTQILRELI